MFKDNFFILSKPRSGSSMLSNILIENGLTNFSFQESTTMNAHEHNTDGYFEDVKLTLLNDQIIKAKYGNEFSFLFPPAHWSAKELNENIEFVYDLDKTTVVIPDDFRDRLLYYTNNKWDVWGLTRMLTGGKWHRAYSKHNVDNIQNILQTIKDFKEIYNSTDGLLIKDPRMIFTILDFNIANSKIIFLQRKSECVVRSCRKHYGPHLFDTQDRYENFPYASNHFNLKVGEMSFDEYGARYANFESLIKAKSDPNSFIEIHYEELLSERSESRNRLECFIGKPLDWSKVRNEKL
jgi:hypothetical protein